MSEYIYGINVCKAAIDSKYPFKQILLEENNYSFIKYLRKQNLPYVLVKRNVLNNINNNHQGIAIEIEKFTTYQLDDIIKIKNNNSNKPLIIMLDGLEDPHNFGAVLRIADAAGVDGVIYRKDRSVKINSTVARVSTGALFFIKCVEVTNNVMALKCLKEKGYWIVGAEASPTSTDYRDIKYDMATVLVIGSEGKGLSRLVKEHCDYLVEIPMVGNVNSLNAAVATGILTFHIKQFK